jgi:hypothetical protein
MIDEAELALCKTVSKRSHVCKQKHPLEFCAVTMLQPRCNILQLCETRVVHLLNIWWAQLQNKSWIYSRVPVSIDTVSAVHRAPKKIGKLNR